jgi:hypothetical protein
MVVHQAGAAPMSEVNCLPNTERFEAMQHAANHARKRARAYMDRAKSPVDPAVAVTIDNIVARIANASAAFALFDMAARAYGIGSAERSECLASRDECSALIHAMRGTDK